MMMKTTMVCVVLFYLVMHPVVYSQEQTQEQNENQSVVKEMLEASNAIRERNGLQPHKLDDKLCKAAQDHAEYMARTGNFSHYANGGPSGRASRYGYNGSVRENIAMGYSTVSSAFGGWRSSGGHYASIVSATSDAGFGYAVSEYGTAYWVAVYGNKYNEETTHYTSQESSGRTYTYYRPRRRFRIFRRRR